MIESKFGPRSVQPEGNGLPIEFFMDGDQFVVALRGEIDAANAPLLPMMVSTAVNGDPVVRLDLADVTFIDSSGLRAVLLIREQFADDGVDVKIRNPSLPARRLLEITGLTDLLEQIDEDPPGRDTPVSAPT